MLPGPSFDFALIQLPFDDVYNLTAEVQRIGGGTDIRDVKCVGSRFVPLPPGIRSPDSMVLYSYTLHQLSLNLWNLKLSVVHVAILPFYNPSGSQFTII